MPKDITEKTSFTFRLDSIAYEKCKIIATKEHRSANGQLEYLIIKSVEQYEKEHGVIDLDEFALD